jgi:glutathione S-transferase
MNRLRAALAAGILLVGACPATMAFGQASSAQASAQPLTIYLAKGRSSLRAMWTAEELGVRYRVETLRNLTTTPAVAPMIKVGAGAAIAEPGAAVEYLVAAYGQGRLAPPKDSPSRRDHLVFTHFAQATGMSRVYRDETRMEAGNSQTYLPNARPGGGRQANDTEVNLGAIDDYLMEHPYFSGPEFGWADIMMVGFYENAFFPGLEPKQYQRFIDWYGRVTSRPAYKRALMKAGPDAKPLRAAPVAAQGPR